MLVYLSLGANLGNREQTINTALDLLSAKVGPLLKRSTFFYSEPWGFDSPNEFCNLCASFDTVLSPLALLQTTQSIEQQLGRTRANEKMKKWENEKMRKYQDRPIDIDILCAFDGGKEITINIQSSETSDYLVLPHPLMAKRPFVIVPLREIAPDLPLFSQK